MYRGNVMQNVISSDTCTILLYSLLV